MEEKIKKLEKIPLKITYWVGTTSSVVVHTIVFIAALTLPFFGYDFYRVLVALTTVLSFEAIYLAIFIQMTVNKNLENLEKVHENVREISEDVEEISVDVDQIQEEEKEEEAEEEKTKMTLGKIEVDLQRLLADIETLKHQKDQQKTP